FAGCAMLALCPGLTLHFPMLDQVYPVITCVLIVTWVMALRTNKIIWAVAFGAFFAGACFIVYHFLVLGAFLSIATFTSIDGSSRKRRALIQSIIAAAMMLVLLYFALYALTGFNAVQVF